MTSEDKTYNGWTNYETWVLNMWMSNDEGSWDYWLKEGMRVQDVSDLSKLMKEHYEEQLPKLEGFAADLLNAAMSEVNWYELAEHVDAEAKEGESVL